MKDLNRREFLVSAVSATAAAGVALRPTASRSAQSKPRLAAGQGVADITPPLGIEMGGFHRPPGQERRVTAIRQPAAVRALVLGMEKTEVAICSLDVACVGREMAARIQKQVAQRTGIPAENVRVAATHTHSMPGFCYLRQWGAIPTEFMAAVEQRAVEAVVAAKADLAPADLSLGGCRVAGGNHNRTTKQYRTDEHFAKDSTDATRWLDTMLHALVFRRPGKRDFAWYHFSAHAVCHADDRAGPDWPGEVARRIRESEKIESSFLQGHCGDVNPGDGRDWRGEINQTVAAVYPALKQAIATATPRAVDCLRAANAPVRVPLEMDLFKRWLDEYRQDPAKCKGGPWVDAAFAADWYRGNERRDLSARHLPITLSAIQLGPVGLVFHPAELFSYYGLAIRRDSPLADTLVVGYTDGMIGYLADPQAYRAGEYAAVTVPKILDYPPFAPGAAQEMTAAAVELMKKVVG